MWEMHRLTGCELGNRHMASQLSSLTMRTLFFPSLLARYMA